MFHYYNIMYCHFSETQIKLINGRTDYMGSVSFDIDGRSEAIRTIDSNMSADVVCKILGYNFTR